MCASLVSERRNHMKRSRMIFVSGLVQEKLKQITPGDILSLFMKFKIDFFFLTSLNPYHYGTLATHGKTWVVVIRKRTSQEENWKTMLHEIFHLFLFDQGIDNPDIEQEFSDSITEKSTDIFMKKYPSFAKNLWQYVHERPKFHL